MKPGISTLYPVKNVRSILYYALWKYDGAMKWPFLCKEAAERLGAAAQTVSKITNGRAELLVWDAYRTYETQAYIFNKYLNQLKVSNSGQFSQEALHQLTKQFVTDPNTPFPHGLGGAVDVAMIIDGKIADFGTGFDEFIPKAASDWFHKNPPSTPEEKEQHSNREIIFEAMRTAGWVGITSEWWHFEYGTPRWANATGKPVIYEKILNPPSFEDAASARDFVPVRQPKLQTGVAPVFTDPIERARSLAHESSSHYYIRSSHPTTMNLRDMLGRMYEAEYVQLTCSGLNALVTTAKAMVPNRGKIICHQQVYYECQGSLIEEKKVRGWEINMVDFSDATALERHLIAGADLLILDNPSNWFLNTYDMQKIATMAARYRVPFVADISVQPLQKVLAAGVTVAVMSLSKYPSLGYEPGGAIFTNELAVMDKIGKVISNDGLILAPAAAERILEHLPSLPDRMTVLSQKTILIGEMLKQHPVVRGVHIANPKFCDGLVGGQLSFLLHRPDQGTKIEVVIGHNALRHNAALHLACTFGASMTTFEHFASNLRHRNTWSRSETNEASIPSDMCRIGVGLEPVNNIMGELQFILGSTS